MFVGFAWPQDCIWKAFLIGRIWIDLGFQAEAISVFVDLAVPTCQSAVKIVASVELDTALVCEHFQYCLLYTSDAADE